MKKIISVLLLLSVCLSMFSGCFSDNNDKSKGIEEEEESESETLLGKAEDIKFDGKDYCLTYVEGRLAGIYINPKAEGDICIDIPAVTEEGKPLRSISPNVMIGQPLFHIYSVEAHEAIVAQIEANSSIARDAKIYNAFFLRMDPNDPTLEPKAKEEMLEDYPIAKYFPICVLEPTLTSQEADRLGDLLRSYTDVDAKYLEKVARDMLELITDDEELKEGYADYFAERLRDMKYGGFEKVTEINFAEAKPGQMIELESEGFALYENLEKISGNLSYYLIDDNAVDESFMEKIATDDEYDTPFFNVLANSYKKGYITVLPDSWDDNTSEPDTSEPDTSDSEQSEIADFVFGAYSGDLYTRNNPRFSWRLPDSTWRFYTKEELATTSKMNASLFNETYLNMASTWLVYDMCAKNDKGSTVAVNIKKLDSDVSGTAESSLHNAATISMLKLQLQAQFGAACTNVVITPCFVTKNDVDYYALDTSYTLSGINVYSKSVVIIRDGYTYTLSFGSTDKNEAESLCNSFEIG